MGRHAGDVEDRPPPSVRPQSAHIVAWGMFATVLAAACLAWGGVSGSSTLAVAALGAGATGALWWITRRPPVPTALSGHSRAEVDQGIDAEIDSQTRDRMPVHRSSGVGGREDQEGSPKRQ